MKNKTTTAPASVTIEQEMSVTNWTPKHAINSNSHRKENSFYKEITVISFNEIMRDGTGEFTTPVTVRFYGAGSTRYACLWVYGENKEGVNMDCNGSGSAGGGGYDKESAAAGQAINKAGIELSQDIDGRGEGAVREAVKAIAQALGYKNIYIHVAHA